MNSLNYVSIKGKAVSYNLAEKIVFLAEHKQFHGYFLQDGVAASDLTVLMYIVNNKIEVISKSEVQEIADICETSAKECLRRLCKFGLICKEEVLIEKKRAAYYRANGESDSYSKTINRVVPWIIATYSGVKKE
jgi:predicted transcriptional regulator